MSEVEKLLPFYDYGRSLAGPFDPERLQPEDVHPVSSPEEAARQLADYMVDVTRDEQWRDEARVLALAALIGEARHRYLHGHSEGDPAVLAGERAGPWHHLDGYHDWRWKVAEPGTWDRPHEDAREVDDAETPEGWAPNNYDDHDPRDDRFHTEWPAIHEHLFTKPRVSDEAAGQQQDRRARGVGKDPDKARRPKTQRTQPQYGVLRHHLGDFRSRRVGTVPFYSVWLLARAFWREAIGSEFRVNFAQAHDESIGRRGRVDENDGHLLGADATWCSTIDAKRLNPASHFWAALCGKLDLLLDLEEVAPDRELWAHILANTGIQPMHPDELGDELLEGLERQRLLLIAERSERAARGALKAPK